MSYLLKFPLSRLSGCVFLLLAADVCGYADSGTNADIACRPRNDSCYGSGAQTPAEPAKPQASESPMTTQNYRATIRLRRSKFASTSFWCG